MPLPRSTPEEQGLPSAALLSFVARAEVEIDALHSFMVLRHGHVVAEGWWTPYAPEHPHMLFSLSKAFTATAIGLAAAERRLTLDDPVLAFFPTDAPAEASEYLKALRVRQLLTMTTGHQEDTTGRLSAAADGNWIRAFLGLPLEHKPGIHFLYNNGASFMLSAIVQQLTGRTACDYLEPRLFAPLGITGADWVLNPQGINPGGWGLSLKTEDIARFGQLYLQRGLWDGEPILAPEWVDAATARQVSTGSNPSSDWDQGYGFKFWRCRHNAYRGDGAFGQFCIVLPDQDAVVAITAGVQDMQAVLQLVWDELLDAMQAAPLPPDAAGVSQLRRQLAGLALPTPQGAASSPLAGRYSRRYRLGENPRGLQHLAIDFSADPVRVTLSTTNGDESLECGYGRWLPGRAALGEEEARPVAAAGAWTDDATYELALCFYETPFTTRVACHFNGDVVRLETRHNVSFGPAAEDPLEGRAE